MAEKKSLGKEFAKGLIKENPVLRLVLGTCPTLAVTTSVESALGMGAAAMIVLVCSNIVISALRKVIPSKVRIPCYIVVIASFVTIVQMLVKAFLPQIDEQLGVYLPLIVVNCIILGRAEAFAGKSPVPRLCARRIRHGHRLHGRSARNGRNPRAVRRRHAARLPDHPWQYSADDYFHSAPRRLLRIRHAHRLRKPARRAQRKAEGNAQLRLLPMADACSRVNCEKAETKEADAK